MTFSDTIQPIHRQLWSGLASDDPAAEVGLLGVPFDGATSFRRGASLAPRKIRELTPHIAPATEEGVSLAGLRVRDYGDTPIDLNWERHFSAVEVRAREVLRYPFALFLGSLCLSQRRKGKRCIGKSRKPEVSLCCWRE